MSDTQFIDNLVRYDCFGVLNNTAKDYNEAVTRLALNDENTFTEELLIAMVRGRFNNLAEQEAAIAFCFSKILEKRVAVSVEQPKANYVPSLTSEWPFWAIDYNGVAYHYKLEPVKRAATWGVVRSSVNMKIDADFNTENFRHMWENGAWEFSLQSLEVPVTYKPNFPSGKIAWAVDNNGVAYFYGTKPTKNSAFWSGSDWIRDEKFDREKFKSMWDGDAWESSLIENDDAIYSPHFEYESDNAWAIDEDGIAYFYCGEYPERGLNGWRSDEYYHMDDKFDAEKYPHMWQNGAWRNSLKRK